MIDKLKAELELAKLQLQLSSRGSSGQGSGRHTPRTLRRTNLEEKVPTPPLYPIPQISPMFASMKRKLKRVGMSVTVSQGQLHIRDDCNDSMGVESYGSFPDTDEYLRNLYVTIALVGQNRDRVVSALSANIGFSANFPTPPFTPPTETSCVASQTELTGNEK
jgi:hypothetical protein